MADKCIIVKHFIIQSSAHMYLRDGESEVQLVGRDGLLTSVLLFSQADVAPGTLIE